MALDDQESSTGPIAGWCQSSQLVCSKQTRLARRAPTQQAPPPRPGSTKQPPLRPPGDRWRAGGGRAIGRRRRRRRTSRRHRPGRRPATGGMVPPVPRVLRAPRERRTPPRPRAADEGSCRSRARALTAPDQWCRAAVVRHRRADNRSRTTTDRPRSARRGGRPSQHSGAEERLRRQRLPRRSPHPAR